jgi:hypothetical protein
MYMQCMCMFWNRQMENEHPWWVLNYSLFTHMKTFTPIFCHSNCSLPIVLCPVSLNHLKSVFSAHIHIFVNMEHGQTTQPFFTHCSFFPCFESTTRNETLVTALLLYMYMLTIHVYFRQWICICMSTLYILILALITMGESHVNLFTLRESRGTDCTGCC